MRQTRQVKKNSKEESLTSTVKDIENLKENENRKGP